MKSKRFRARVWHKWLGLIVALFVLMFCVSGVILNHPSVFVHSDVPSTWMPEDYHYHQWNRGLLRGSVPWRGHVLVYGSGGVYLTDSLGRQFDEFNAGLPSGADSRNIRAMAVMPSQRLFAVSAYGLYEYSGWKRWSRVEVSPRSGRLADLAVRGDTLVVVSRSHLYVALPPYRHFRQVALPAAAGMDRRVSLFSTVWQLHSGALFGTPGRYVVDAVAVVFALLVLSGLAGWILPHCGRRLRCGSRHLLSWHNRVGRLTLFFTLLLCLSGWLLRPPVLLAIAYGRIPALPMSSMDSPNPWNDHLRLLRYDARQGDWLLSTSEGMFSLPGLGGRPQRIDGAPPVSVMGANVMRQNVRGEWMVGSFSGLFVWNRSTGRVADYFHPKAPVQDHGVPMSLHPISGYSADFHGKTVVADYRRGTTSLIMPQRFASLPMSLRAVALEVHTGRVFTFLGRGTAFYVGVIGLAVGLCLVTGWRRRTKKRHRTEAVGE